MITQQSRYRISFQLQKLYFRIPVLTMLPRCYPVLDRTVRLNHSRLICKHIRRVAYPSRIRGIYNSSGPCCSLARGRGFWLLRGIFSARYLFLIDTESSRSLFEAAITLTSTLWVVGSPRGLSSPLSAPQVSRCSSLPTRRITHSLEGSKGETV